jgi:2-polyprenyl-6-methoxyphenol hydroxylase-like FAD-dependent oxidoreductase
MRAVIAVGGIGGLAAAVALHRRGIQVSILERAAQLDLGGAGLSLWPNALRALDRLGVGDPVREHAVLSGTSNLASGRGPPSRC